jgi:hypothetical protein
MDQSRVVPLLFNLETADVSLPLARFQMKRLDEQGVFETLESINKSLVENQLSENHLRIVFDAMWPSLKSKLDAVPRGEQPPQRPDRELLEEILSVLRRMSNLSAASRFVNPGVLSFSPVGMRKRPIPGP